MTGTLEHAQTLERPGNPNNGAGWRFCVAPMMDWTDRHCRYFHRLLAPHARLYTEMVTSGAVLHGDRERLLGFSPSESPVALQLGGHEPADLAACARIGAELGYAEINLNVGCPSDRVQSGRFGACLLREPTLVADCVAAMRAAVGIPVTVKCRIGVDAQDEYEDLKAVTSIRGARNISDFARSELLTSIEQERRPDVRLSDVDKKLTSLESKIQRMSQLLEGMADRK